MSDHPIIFSGPMVRALLDGRKTMTRRVLKLPTKHNGRPIYERADMGGWEQTTVGGGKSFTINRRGERVPAPEKIAVWHRTCGTCVVLRHQPGDSLWVRETWKAALTEDGHRCAGYMADMTYGCGKKIPQGPHKWRSPIHMPRWASRLTLVVTAVRIERLNAITRADAIAEGIAPAANSQTINCDTSDPRDGFCDLWNSLHGAVAWAANPEVVVLTFTVHRMNIDAMARAA